MSLAATIPTAVLETILARLAILFLSGAAGDLTAARQAASHMLAAYHPETEDELRLAARIISFSFQALEALSQAAAPDMPLTRILRLRGSAVSLSRESDRAQRRLDQLQKARKEARPAQLQSEPTQPEPAQPEPAQPEPAQPEPRIEKALDLIEDTRTVAAVAKANGITWTQAHEQRQRDIRIAASLKRAEARVAAHRSATAITMPPAAPPV
jgi:hypothetical protein